MFPWGVAWQLLCCGFEAGVGEDSADGLVIGDEVAFLVVAGPP
jgi:hypothetical protein